MFVCAENTICLWLLSWNPWKALVPISETADQSSNKRAGSYIKDKVVSGEPSVIHSDRSLMIAVTGSILSLMVYIWYDKNVTPYYNENNRYFYCLTLKPFSIWHVTYSHIRNFNGVKYVFRLWIRYCDKNVFAVYIWPPLECDIQTGKTWRPCRCCQLLTERGSAPVRDKLLDLSRNLRRGLASPRPR